MKPSRRRRRRSLLTIRELAQLRGVSERTVRRDITAGYLRAIHINRRVIRIDRRAAQRYRPHQPDYLTPLEAAQRLLLSRRAIWSLIQSGRLPIVKRLNRRRVFVSARAVASLSPKKPLSAAAQQFVKAPPPYPIIYTVTHPGLTVRSFANLTGRSVRSIYHDISKGAITPARTTALRLIGKTFYPSQRRQLLVPVTEWIAISELRTVSARGRSTKREPPTK